MEDIYQALLRASEQVLKAKLDPNIRDLEAIWGQYKYLVLEYSPSHYQAIRQLLKDKTAYPREDLLNLLHQALDQPLDPAKQMNAYDHVWGHFKHQASQQEKSDYLDLRQAFQDQQIDAQALKTYLYQLTQTYQDKYLSQSYFFAAVDRSMPF